MFNIQAKIFDCCTFNCKVSFMTTVHLFSQDKCHKWHPQINSEFAVKYQFTSNYLRKICKNRYDSAALDYIVCIGVSTSPSKTPPPLFLAKPHCQIWTQLAPGCYKWNSFSLKFLPSLFHEKITVCNNLLMVILGHMWSCTILNLPPHMVGVSFALVVLTWLNVGEPKH